MHRGLREFLHALEAAGELHRVRAEVDAELEVAEIADRACRMAANPSEGARSFDPAMAAAGG
jgi:4-hydroxy-3-polyprenylbenzoate decarboxylase